MAPRKNRRRWQTLPCPRNEGIECGDQSRCGKCGWNPEVARARAAAYTGAGKERKHDRHKRKVG